MTNEPKYRNRFTDVTVRVTATRDSRLQILNTTTGNREWIDAHEFRAHYRPVVEAKVREDA